MAIAPAPLAKLYAKRASNAGRVGFPLRLTVPLAPAARVAVIPSLSVRRRGTVTLPATAATVELTLHPALVTLARRL
jgi:hypothetical protein